MVKMQNFRFSAMSKILTILITSIFTALLVYQFLPIDMGNFSVGILQIIFYNTILVVIISFVVFFLLGRKPKGAKKKV